MTDWIASFVDRLAQTPAPEHAYNPFQYRTDAAETYNTLRRANLRLYLEQLATYQTKVMLVMEAPGYRGMRITGVPVTSRKMLREGVELLGMLGTVRGYQDVAEPGFENIQGEQTSTIVWGTLSALGVRALIWGAYPFHPHKPGEALSNRAPRRPEVALGQPFLKALLGGFAPTTVIAVGNVGRDR